MRLQTVCRMIAVTAVSLTALQGRAAVSETNPLCIAAIATGGEQVNSSIKNQTKDMEKTGLLQAAMSAEFTQMKSWERKYNGYLTTARGYADALRAGCTLYAEGVE